MSALLPTTLIDSDAKLARHFMPHQLHWIQSEDAIHARKKQAYALAEKSVRIGWTYADAFKNVRKRLRFNKRHYLFATKDWPSALEYMNQVYEFAELFDLTGTIVSHGEEPLEINRLDADGRLTGFTDEIKVGTIKFDNGSRIIAFSAHPQAMAVYGGDVGLDEFAKHPNARLLWQTAQGRVTWGYDIAVWSSHDGQDTLFHQFAQEARAGKGPWNLFYRVTLPDAIELGLVEVINRTHNTHFTPHQFLADCRARAGSEEIYQQSYLCNPSGAAAAAIVDWSAIERCRADYSIERLHLESNEILQHFGQPGPGPQSSRESQIHSFLRDRFPFLLGSSNSSSSSSSSSFSSSFSSSRSDAPRSNAPRSNAPPSNAPPSNAPPSDGHSAIRIPQSAFRLGFDVAASGQGDLAAIYIDEVALRQDLWLRALLTARTEDWHFLKTALFFFLQHLPRLEAAGDESGLGRQICWEAASQFSSRFTKVNFASKKHDLGFALMNQLSVAEKRFPRSEYDIAADFFALRKIFSGTKWIFTEGRNTSNPASHCDIAWAAALSSHAHTIRRHEAGALVC